MRCHNVAIIVDTHCTHFAEMTWLSVVWMLQDQITGDTLLHYAVINCDADMIQMILSKVSDTRTGALRSGKRSAR